MKTKIGAFGAGHFFSRDTCSWLTRHHYLSKAGGGGGLGGVAYKDRARPPPRAGNVAQPRCPWPTDPRGLGIQCAHRGASSKGASRSCQRCWKALLYLSDTARLGQAHGHRKLAVGEWRGDGPFDYELPNKIPVLEANSTSRMDELGG